MFAVVEFNQASQQPGDEAMLFGSRTGAFEERDDLERRAREIGRREFYRVYELTEVEDEDLGEER